MAEYRRAAHTGYRLHYHFVFITRYRKPVLRGEVGTEVRDLIREICRSWDIEILQGTFDRITSTCCSACLRTCRRAG